MFETHFRVHGRTTNNMVYGVLGRFSLEIQIKKDDWLLGEINYRKGIETMETNI